MKTRLLIGAIGIAAVIAATSAISSDVAQAQTSAPEILALRGNTLIRITQTAPGTAKATVAVTGLNSGDSLLGIDVRPANSTLYGIGSSGVIYTIDPVTGAATAGPTAATLPSGTNFGVDFNPAADRLRVISNTGQSLRINVVDGVTTVDTSVAYGSADAGNGTTPVVSAVAYTNNDTDTATATELFDIESARDVLVLQAPPNDGTLVTRGALGVNAGVRSAFDIAPDGTSMAILAGTLYRVDLTTGAATAVGAVTGGLVDGMAFVPAVNQTTTTTTIGSTSSTVPTTPTTRALLPRTGDNTTTGLGVGGVLLLAFGGALVALAAGRRAKPAHLLRRR